jgi:hypothetical protein
MVFFAAVGRVVRERDLVVLVEGSAHMDTWTPALLWYFLWATRCTDQAGKPSLAYAVDAGQLSRLERWLTRRVASRSELIVTRAQAAAERLRSWGVTAPITATADNAFNFQPRPGGRRVAGGDVAGGRRGGRAGAGRRKPVPGGGPALGPPGAHQGHRSQWAGRGASQRSGWLAAGRGAGCRRRHRVHRQPGDRCRGRYRLAEYGAAGRGGQAGRRRDLDGRPRVRVGSQRDAEQADIGRERWELDADPDFELAELTEIYGRRGLDPPLAATVADG